MSYIVESADINNLTLNETDTVKSILQNVAIIIATRKGNVPMERGLGLSQDFLDQPVNVAQVLATAEIKEAVEEYEPRCRVKSVSFNPDADRNAVLIPSVEVEIIGEES